MKPLTIGIPEVITGCIDLVEDEKDKFENDHPAFYELHNVVYHLMKARHTIEKHNDIREGR